MQSCEKCCHLAFVDRICRGDLVCIITARPVGAFHLLMLPKKYHYASLIETRWLAECLSYMQCLSASSQQALSTTTEMWMTWTEWQSDSWQAALFGSWGNKTHLSPFAPCCQSTIDPSLTGLVDFFFFKKGWNNRGDIDERRILPKGGPVECGPVKLPATLWACSLDFLERESSGSLADCFCISNKWCRRVVRYYYTAILIQKV